MGFIDDKVNHLLALEKEKEASIAMAALDSESNQDFAHNEIDSTEKEQIPSLSLKIDPLSRKEIQYPEIWKTYNCSKLHSGNEVKEWTKFRDIPNIWFYFVQGRFSTIQRKNIEKTHLSNDYRLFDIPSIGETILRRGSTRRF